MSVKITVTLFVAAFTCVGFAVSPTDFAPELLAQWGLAGLVVALVMWRDWAREKRMSASIEKQTKWIQETMLEALRSNTKAIDRCYHTQGVEELVPEDRQ